MRSLLYGGRSLAAFWKEPPMKTSRFVAAAALLAAGLAASQAAQAASHPVKSENCGVTLLF